MKLTEIEGRSFSDEMRLPFRRLSDIKVRRILQPGGRGKYYIPLDSEDDWYLLPDGSFQHIYEIKKTNQYFSHAFFNDLEDAKKVLNNWISQGWHSHEPTER